MPSFRLLSLLALLLALPAAAQTLSESVEVHVMELEAVVLGADGKPVDGLTADDFEVRVDGKPASVTNFFAVRRGAIVDEAPVSPGPAVSAPAPVVIPTRLVIFLDYRHLHQRTLGRAADAVRRFVDESMDATTTATLVRWNGSLSTLVPHTRDRERLERELSRMAKDTTGLLTEERERDFIAMAASSANDAQLAWAMRRRFAERTFRENEATIQALREVVTSAAGLSGRRILLYVSEGLPQMSAYEEMKSVPTEAVAYDHTRELRRLADDAQKAGVAFCTLDPSGVPEFWAPNDRENQRSPVTMLARQTGGTLITDTNDLGSALLLLTENMTSYYSIGVRGAPDRPGAAVKIRVRDRPELRVITSTRKTSRSSREAVSDSVVARLYLREEENPIGVRLAIGAPYLEKKQCVARVAIAVPASGITFAPAGKVSLLFSLLDDREQESEVKTRTHDVTGPLAETLVLGLQKRKYVASFAIVDELSGRTAYLQREVDARECR